MAKALPPQWVAQLFDNYGELLNGGKIYTYEGNTSTPKATYTDYGGLTPRSNPIVLDAAGRATGGIWLTEGEAYKFIIKTAADVDLDTIDNIIAGEIEADTNSQYLVNATYAGTPGAQEWLGGDEVSHSVTFPVNFAGACASVQTNPASDYEISIQKNGVEVGSVTFNSSGAATFETVGGATVPCSFGDTLSFVAPASVGTAANILIKLVGDL